MLNFGFDMVASVFNGNLLTYVPFWPPKSFTIHRTDLQSVPSPLLRDFNCCRFWRFRIPATTNLISPDKFQVVARHIGAIAYFNITLPISANRYLLLQAKKSNMCFKVRQGLTGTSHLGVLQNIGWALKVPWHPFQAPAVLGLWGGPSHSPPVVKALKGLWHCSELT